VSPLALSIVVSVLDPCLDSLVATVLRNSPVKDSEEFALPKAFSGLSYKAVLHRGLSAGDVRANENA